jgi:hypothetical protein
MTSSGLILILQVSFFAFQKKCGLFSLSYEIDMSRLTKSNSYRLEIPCLLSRLDVSHFPLVFLLHKRMCFFCLKLFFRYMLGNRK